MQIFINNKLAAMKEGTSFEYVSENRLFSGSDGYTLTITFPLRDCPQNQAIFGHINRADVTASKVLFDCEIRDGGFCRFGCITITEIDESEVKTQFLDGRSEQNFDKSFDKVYINELDLGAPEVTSAASISPSNAWRGNRDSVALPWVNDASGNIQNCAVYNNVWQWHADTSGLSWQPYLLFITKKICEQVGYSYDFAEWEAREEYRYLLVCNCLPYSWGMPGYAYALPHWTVEEFFAKLELFLGGEFDIDHRGRHIDFAFTEDIVSAKPVVPLDEIVEEHSTEVKQDDDSCDYSEARNLAYKDCDHSMWKFYSCDWFVSSWRGAVKRYDRMTQLLADNSGYSEWDGSNLRGSNMNKLLYAADIDTYFIIRAYHRIDTGQRTHNGNVIVWRYKCALQPVNMLGPRIVDDSEDATQDEIEFVPACVDYTDENFGWCLFLAFNGYDENANATESMFGLTQQERYDRLNALFAQTLSAQTLEAGEGSKRSEYFDRIYIGWWDGALDAGSSLPPFPHVMNVEVSDDWTNFRNVHFSLRLNATYADRYRLAMPIEPTKKCTFKFLASKVPDVRSLFVIRGKRYVCERITATFTEKGMSQLLKGEFYPVKE